jgi:multiple sugar transport system substrate-binding protein
MAISRRQFLAGTGGVAAATWLSACGGGFGGGGDDDSGGGAGTLTFMTWAGVEEEAAFKQMIADFEAANSGTTVKLQVVPYGEMFTNIDAGLQAGTAPDIFRVDFPSLGKYSSTGQLLQVDDKLDSSVTGELIPALFEAVKFEDKAFGIPLHTDTTAIVYRPDMLEAAGITSVPDSLDNAWSWEEFADVASKLKGSLSGNTYPFAYDWQLAGAFRWLTWLFEADGRILEDDLTTPAIVSAEGVKALEFTRSFFENEWVPKNTSVKGATYPDAAFVSGQLAMAYVGNFLLASMEPQIANKFDWQVTYQPRDVRASSDLGGTALVANANPGDADLAGEFLNFMAGAEPMGLFCEETTVIPTRNDLLDSDMSFAVRPDLMPVFLDMATTITPEDVAQVTTPFFGEVNTILQNELELCFQGGQSADDTLNAIAAGVEKAAG